jgi:GNAT superfamily N-acetyltransferase
MEIRGLPLGIAIRAIRADDLIPLERFYAGLSPDSTDARFHGATHGIADDTARSFCGPDHVHREGLVAVARTTDDAEVIVGHLCLEPAPDGNLEMAVAVADRWQHQGIGRALLLSAIDWAEAHRVQRLHAAIRWSNPAIMGLLRSVDRPITIRSDQAGELDAVIDLTGALPAAA